MLKSFKPVNKIIDREFMEMFDLKRNKINEQIHILLVPYPAPDSAKNKKEKPPVTKYLCLRYVAEERILNDVLDVFKDA